MTATVRPADRCGSLRCRRRLTQDGPSPWWCDEACQAVWQAERAGVLPPLLPPAVKCPEPASRPGVLRRVLSVAYRLLTRTA